MLTIANATIDDSVKPAIEWIHGKAVQKLMPTDFHAFIQLAFARFLDAWARIVTHGRGRIGCEWRFVIPPNSYNTQSVVPDVAYLSTYFDLPKANRAYPNVPPDIVVEVLSPGDGPQDVADKREFYLWWGVKLVIIADPERLTVQTHERDGETRLLTENDTLLSKAFPTLEIRLRDMFAEIEAFESA